MTRVCTKLSHNFLAGELPASIAHPDPVGDRDGRASTLLAVLVTGRTINQLLKSSADPPSGTVAISFPIHSPSWGNPNFPREGDVLFFPHHYYFPQMHRQHPIHLSFSASTFKLPSRDHSVRFGHPRLKNTSISSRIAQCIEPLVRLNSYQAFNLTNPLSLIGWPSGPLGERASQR